MLDLAEPSIVVERGQDALDDLKRESIRMEHAIYFEEN
jgi:hypothetical protein